MFYCEACRKRKKWPTSLVRSMGPCEVCGTDAFCWDRASDTLPSAMTPEQRAEFEAVVDQIKAETHYWLRSSSDEPWREVSKEDFVKAERAAQFGRWDDPEPATGGFSSSRTPVRGTTTIGEDPPNHER